jgi:inorganic pyrophosphatase/exopolyphosphatase
MFNPLVDSFDNLTDSEVEESISNLSRKYFQTQNPHVQAQITSVLEMYKAEMRTRNARAMQKMRENNGEDGLDNLINIS